METDSLKYDSVPVRPLPQWLIRQREGLNTYQPEKIVMKEDKHLQSSFIITGVIIVLVIIFLTIRVIRKMKNIK